MHENKVEFEVYGDFALFSDPITRVGGEKCSYQIPTYEAIKGVLQSIYFKPTIIWVIDEVRVMNQIVTKSKGILRIDYNSSKNDLSNYTYLKDCKYQVRAHFIWNENRPELENDRNENKHHNIAKRSILKGGRRDIFLGTRECQAYVEPCVFGSGVGYYDNIPLKEYGRMYHGITYADESYSKTTKGKLTVRFWNDAKMENGYIKYPKPWECTGNDERVVREMNIKPFGKDLNNFIGSDEFTNEEVNEIGLDAEVPGNL